jgi:hypothetical protein
MKASICFGLRRRSLVRSAALRSGLSTISSMRCADSVGWEDGDVEGPAHATSAIVMHAARILLIAPPCSK